MYKNKINYLLFRFNKVFIIIIKFFFKNFSKLKNILKREILLIKICV